MKHEDLIAQYLASGGTVTKCPPRTFAIDPTAPRSWKETQEARWRMIRRANRFEAAKRKAREPQAPAAEVLTPVNPLPPKPVAKAATKPVLAVQPRQKIKPAAMTVAGVPLPQVVEMIRGGMTAAEVAAKLGTSKNTICSRLHKAGIKIADLRPKLASSNKTRAFSDEAIRAAVEGRTLAEAAAILGATPRAMRNYIAALGLKPKRAPRIQPVVETSLQEAAA